jgi:hypothetical protein
MPGGSKLLPKIRIFVLVNYLRIYINQCVIIRKGENYQTRRIRMEERKDGSPAFWVMELIFYDGTQTTVVYNEADPDIENTVPVSDLKEEN